jgi:hypothetical protein
MRHTLQPAFARITLAACALCLVALTGCNIDYKVVEAEEGDGTSSPGADGGGAEPSGSGWGSGSDPVGPDSGAPSGDICRRGGECLDVSVTNIDKVDLLFVVDNSGSMAEEQAALIAQFPKLIGVLATGDRDADGNNDFPPAKNMHLGVVSSDLGLVGVTGIDKCLGLGDDGVMNDDPSPQVPGCDQAYPRFLTYTAGIYTPEATANDLACIATLGTDGCGFEQPLETALKALWSADDALVTFLPDPQGNGAMGQGDNGGMNAGFLRSNPVEGLSLLSIVLLSDEDDCSLKDTGILRPEPYLDPSAPTGQRLLTQGLNTRCHRNPDALYRTERYVNAFRALRPGHEDLVQFSAIVGVPSETVASVPDDYGKSESARAQFYAGIRDHELMQPRIDDKGTPDPQDDSLHTSCDTSNGKAYPPNRIVDVAESFGENGLVQSICQDDFGPAIDAIIDRMAVRLGAKCLPHGFARDEDGLLGCDVIWELPLPNTAPAGTPVICRESPFLLPVDDGATTPEGAALCRVAQLAVQDGTFFPTETDGMRFNDGWYYDDFSEDVMKECSPKLPLRARVAFTPGAMPPTGVSVYLDCDD